MTKEEIIEMAKQVGFEEHQAKFDTRLEPFAKLVAQHEREACAEIAEQQRYAMQISLTSHPVQNGTAVGILNAIRARGDKHDTR